ncbi:hypothetical protein QE152_g6336 [Popillia japonica]|uniref:RNA polymerase alpha subunit n=1 Tax=Popillia japonica TaxID=7064 RepID=A0AAW1MII2_POPJA
MRLQSQSKLTLEEAILAARQAEIQISQSQILRQETRQGAVYQQKINLISDDHLRKKLTPGKPRKALKDLPGSMLSQIQKTNESIRGPDGSRLDVLGKIGVTLSHEIRSFNTHIYVIRIGVTLSHEIRSFNTHIYVIRNLERPILGRFAIEKLRILELQGHNHSLRNVERSDSILNEFPKIFQDVGNYQHDYELSSEVEAHVYSIIGNLPIKDSYLQEIIKQQEADNILQKIKQYCINNWPEKSALPIEILP